MKFEDFKNDSLVKWCHDGRFFSWNTFGRVVKLKEDNVVILTYDYLQETTLQKNNPEIKEAIELITKDEFIVLVKNEISKLNVRKTKIENEFKNDIKKIQNLKMGVRKTKTEKTKIEIEFKNEIENIDNIINTLNELV